MSIYCPMCDDQVQLDTGKNACPDCGTVLRKNTPTGPPPQPDDGDSEPEPLDGPGAERDSDPEQPSADGDDGECPNCGRTVESDFAVCPYCQASLPDDTGGPPANVCPACGYDELQSGMQVCPMCAEPLDEDDGAGQVGDDADGIDPNHPAAKPDSGPPQPADGDGAGSPSSVQLRFDAGPVMSADDGTSLGVEIRKKLNAAGVSRRDAMRVSRRHVMFKRDADGFHVVDLESSNGTQLNGDRLEPNREYELSDGDVLGIAGIAEATVRF